MAWCRQAPSHYLNQYWLILSKVLWHSSEDIIMRRSEDTNQQNKIERNIFRIAFRFPRGQWVNTRQWEYTTPSSHQYRKPEGKGSCPALCDRCNRHFGIFSIVLYHLIGPDLTLFMMILYFSQQYEKSGGYIFLNPLNAMLFLSKKNIHYILPIRSAIRNMSVPINKC